MTVDRRSFLKLLLASAIAETVDVEKLLWVPKPIIVVPDLSFLPGTYGAIDRATFTFWRNQQYPFDTLKATMRELYLQCGLDA